MRKQVSWREDPGLLTGSLLWLYPNLALFLIVAIGLSMTTPWVIPIWLVVIFPLTIITTRAGNLILLRMQRSNQEAVEAQIASSFDRVFAEFRADMINEGWGFDRELTLHYRFKGLSPRWRPALEVNADLNFAHIHALVGKMEAELCAIKPRMAVALYVIHNSHRQFKISASSLSNHFLMARKAATLRQKSAKLAASDA